MSHKNYVKIVLTVYLLSSQFLGSAKALKDTISVSTVNQAIIYLNSIKGLDSSKHWPNIDPALLWQNLNASIRGPLKSFEGKNTNFCAYTALSYVPLRYDPLGFATFIVELYQKGEARMGREVIKPGKRIKQAAGLMMYKGELDVNHLGQLWFLSLADHFKGYLNMINTNFDEGDENTLWAATNFSKFNRMLRRLFGYEVKGKGSDLVRPEVKNIYDYLYTRLQKGTVFLYLNNRVLYKKNHEVSRFGVPTHYVVLTGIHKEPDDRLTIIYWDAGRKTLQQVTPALLNRIIFGITYLSSPEL